VFCILNNWQEELLKIKFKSKTWFGLNEIASVTSSSLWKRLYWDGYC